MDHLQDIINDIESYGDCERYLGKALVRGDDIDAARWDKAADKALTDIRRQLAVLIGDDAA